MNAEPRKWTRAEINAAITTHLETLGATAKRFHTSQKVVLSLLAKGHDLDALVAGVVHQVELTEKLIEAVNFSA